MLEDYPVEVRAVTIGGDPDDVLRIWMWPHATVADTKAALRLRKGQLCHNGQLLRLDTPLRNIAADNIVDVGVRKLRVAPV